MAGRIGNLSMGGTAAGAFAAGAGALGASAAKPDKLAETIKEADSNVTGSKRGAGRRGIEVLIAGKNLWKQSVATMAAHEEMI
ncbi:MAG: hypothetical protein ACYCZX_06375 [Rhodospirillaceae bacterium]